jgi:hypothetical protein
MNSPEELQKFSVSVLMNAGVDSRQDMQLAKMHPRLIPVFGDAG